ncbi:MAG: hypothetical protein MUO76_23880 [Anaerolineaceae bacterium]|nr:hypothetical protein [Anaerolineaceae bacterium]
MIIVLLLPTACGSPSQPPTEKPLPTATQPEPASMPDQGKELPKGSTDLVSASGNCVMCHTGLVDEDGNDASLDSLWRATMMANAARDPYWLATVSSEILLQPELTAVIEDKCATCHMPLAHFDATTNQQSTLMFNDGFSNPEHPLYELAQDGVSCNVCHQIQPDNFGQPESFSGHFLIDAEAEERVVYGPFPTSPDLSGSMQQVSGYLPVQSEHLAESDMCAICHNLYTPYLDAEGNIAGEFPEQVVYQEWLNSDYASTQTCADCHMPPAVGEVQMSIMNDATYSPFSLHSFTGANAFILKMLAENGEEMQVTAESSHFEDTIKTVTDLLQTRTGTVEIIDAERSETGELLVSVSVQNLAGHKFPSGYPSRRAWLHLTVRDASDTVLFESGAYQPNGLILENDNDQDPASYEPHYSSIQTQDQVQIYEIILANTDGEVTTTLLRAAAALKDNRILPQGFDISSAQVDIQPQGLAVEDADFIGGGDLVGYQIDTSTAEGPLTISVELLYQSVGYRWANNLRSYNTDETDRFIRFYDGMENIPTQVDATEISVE